MCFLALGDSFFPMIEMLQMSKFSSCVFCKEAGGQKFRLIGCTSKRLCPLIKTVLSQFQFGKMNQGT